MDGNKPNIHTKIFDGSDYVPELDNERLGKQMKRVFLAMMDGRWRTLSEVEKITGDPQASISAQLRHMRKPKFGSHTIEKRTRGERQRGLFEYRLILNNSRSI
jgi:hypothetical protein